MTITKRSLKQALGYEHDTQVAKFFGTTKQAVGRWQEDEPLPEGRQWQAIALRPKVFGPASDEGEGGEVSDVA